jgi:hypothetical protein
VSREFVRKLAAAKDALSHSLPGADEAAILEAGLDLILERAAKRKGLVKRPHKTPSDAVVEGNGSRKASPGSGRAGARAGVAAGSLHDGTREVRGEEAEAKRCDGAASATVPESRHIPAGVQRQVWIRDGGRCAWPSADGGVCGSTYRLQFDHIVPVAKGGKSTVTNVRVCCAFHNDLSAREVFGNEWMDRCTKGAGGRGLAPAPPRSAAPV